MRHLTLLAALSLTALAGGASAQEQTIHVGGTARTYILHVPTGLPANPPLMFMLCGHGMTGAQQESLTQMDPIADREKFLVAYPDAVNMNWDQTGTTDIDFILALLDSISARYHPDSNRVYVTGFSQGAAMVHILGCDDADKFAAIAPVSGNIPDSCSPARALPMFVTFGTKDIFPASVFLAGAQSWAQLDGCPATPTVTRPYPADHPKSVVTRLDWGPCRNGAEVIADSIQGGPHEWPMDSVTKVNNSEEVWAFLKKFTLSTSTGLSRPSFPIRRSVLSAWYADDAIHLQGVNEKSRVRIVDEQGRLVAEGTAIKGRFPLAGKPGGVYQVLANDGTSGIVSAKIVIP